MLLAIVMILQGLGFRMSEAPKAAMEKLFADVWNGQYPETVATLVHEDYTIHDRDLANELAGPRLYRALAESTREIFPDARFTIEEIFGSGDKVVIRWRMTGTHEGELYGVKPTGTTVELPAIEINRFTDDKLVETWTQSDTYGLLEQIDAVSSPGETA